MPLLALLLAALAAACSAAPQPQERTPVSAAAEAPGDLSYPYLTEQEAAIPGFRAVAEANAASYVRIVLHREREENDFVDDGPEMGTSVHTGSGVVLDRDGHILTVAHIAKGTDYTPEVTLRDGRTLRGAVIDISPDEELALIRIPPVSGLRPVRLGRQEAIRPGAAAVAIGSPGDQWGVVSVGRIRLADIGERLQYGNWGFDNAVEIAMKVEIGHSGGPVLNLNGEMIGMVAGFELGPRYSDAPPPRITYAVPIENIRAWLSLRLPALAEDDGAD